MRLLITGICGFVGSQLARELRSRFVDLEVVGIDNLARRGSETNISVLRELGCTFIHGDVRSSDDLAEIARCDFILDCAALPSVLAGVDGGTSQLIGHNLIGTLNLLEKCRRDSAGLIILSSSRVYSIDGLNAIPLREQATRLEFDEAGATPPGSSIRGIAETFSTEAPISLYGSTKLASEIVALEYGSAFGFPVRINRCGVIAGAGQFGRIDQGIFSYWIYQWLLGKPLGYIGFGGSGKQVRDFVCPSDLANLIEKQLRQPSKEGPRTVNVGGGRDRSFSLCELSAWCAEQLGPGPKISGTAQGRRYDIPYFVTDSTLAERTWDWAPRQTAHQTLDDIARWAQPRRDQLATFGV